MKTTRNVVVDVEINEHLKREDSASELINRLLRDYYEKERLRKLSKEELSELKRMVIERDKINEEIERKVRDANDRHK